MDLVSCITYLLITITKEKEAMNFIAINLNKHT